MGSLFGTDGIRGRAGEGWLSTGAARLIGLTLGRDLDLALEKPEGAPHRAVLGHDGRRSGPELQAAFAEGLREAGYECVSAGLITTPGLAIIGRLDSYDLAVMISASHNPARDNGIKIFGPGGEKLADEVEEQIEMHLLAAGLPEAPCEAAPMVTDFTLEESYIAFLVKASGGLSLAGLDIVLDCANGGGSRIAPKVLGRLGARVHTIAAEPDGDNINKDCGATHLEYLQSEVRRQGTGIGIALDGDGDRCMLIDENGGVIHGDGVMTMLSRYAMRNNKWADPRIVATVMSNKGLHRALRDVGVGVLTVGVGDRSVVAGLKAENLPLGGEQSGHIVFGSDLFHIGDGTYTALRVLEVLRSSQLPLSELAAPYQPYPQVLLNIPVTSKPPFASIPGLQDAAKKVESELGEDGRVLLRYSGTESLARVMVEGPSATLIEEHAHMLAGLFIRQIGVN
jgi:phosphoglucosamine mutase